METERRKEEGNHMKRKGEKTERERNFNDTVQYCSDEELELININVDHLCEVPTVFYRCSMIQKD
jgi:hypothetical protein